MISRRIVFEIFRLKNEGYSNSKISEKLNLSRNTIKKYFDNPDIMLSDRKKRISKLDEFEDIIDEYLKQDPKISAMVIYRKIKDKGYNGKTTILGDYLKKKRGKIKTQRAFIRFESKPGQQMQVDWGHFGIISYGKIKRKLSALVVIEAYSRMLYIQFTHSQNQETLHMALLNAFKFFGGTPLELIVDNMKTAVVERSGSFVRFNESFLEFLRPFKIKPQACNVRAPHEKGKVENAVKYLRNNFYPLRKFNGLCDANKQVIEWLSETANQRIHKTTNQKPLERHQKEALQILPENIPQIYETRQVKVHKDFSILFDTNYYTVPPWTVGEYLIVKADQSVVKLFKEDKLLATHQRCWNKKRRIESSYHKEQAKKLNNDKWQDSAIREFASFGDEFREYLEGLETTRIPIKKNISILLELKQKYDKASLSYAIFKAIRYKAYGADYIENILYQEMTPKNMQPPVKLKNDSLNNIRLTEPSLAEYDEFIFKRRKTK
jgi:transposase